MYSFDYQRPADRAAAAAAVKARCALPGRRPEPDPGDEAAPVVQRAAGRPGRHRRPEGHQGRRQQRHHRRDDHARHGGRVRPRCRRPSRRWPNWPAASATRWCATWARSAARSPTPTRPPATRPRCWAWARRCNTDQRTIAADSFFTGLYETALQPGELIVVGQLPDPAEGGVHQVQAAGLALCAGGRVRQPGCGRRARGRDRRQEQRVPRRRRSKPR